MRVTNSMITAHSQTNINITKNLVDKYNDQMTSHKKISKPSDDPVIAIRSLRLRSTLNEVNQFYTKNIPDAESWMEVTETSLGNMEEILKDIYTQCVNGSNDTLSADNRNALLKNLTALKQQLYAEGNSDYAGRTIFTGYKTNSTLTFPQDTPSAKYEISQKFGISDVKSKRYYANELEIPSSTAGIMGGIDINDEMKELTYDRIRLAYSDTANGTPTVKVNGDAITDLELKDENGDPVYEADGVTPKKAQLVTMSYANWKAADFVVDDNTALYIPETGEIVFGKNVSATMKSDATGHSDYEITVDYEKQGFKKGEVRPEMYFDCVDNSTDVPVTYKKENQDIEYNVSANQTLKVNTQASDDGILSTAIGRDMDELLDAVSAAVAADDKVIKLKAMLKESQYADENSQKKLGEWLAAAEKEKTFADKNVQQLFSAAQTSVQSYQNDVNLAKTDVGSRDSRLKLTKTRMSNQQATVKSLLSQNEDREMSDILIDYKSAYTAYESALSAASKASTMTLLDYL